MVLPMQVMVPEAVARPGVLVVEVMVVRGPGNSSVPGPAYGSSTEPTDLGSGGAGGNANQQGRKGGGAIKIKVSGTLDVSEILQLMVAMAVMVLTLEVVLVVQYTS